MTRGGHEVSSEADFCRPDRTTRGAAREHEGAIELDGCPGSDGATRTAPPAEGKGFPGLWHLPETERHPGLLERRADHVVIAYAHPSHGHEKIAASESALDGRAGGR